MVLGVPLGNLGGLRGDLESVGGWNLVFVISEVEAQPPRPGLCEGGLVYPRTSCTSRPWGELAHR